MRTRILHWKRALAVLLSLSLVLASVPAQAGKITRYVHTDHLGSVSAKTDSTGVVMMRRSFTPYGENEQAETDGPGYTGHYSDTGSGLVYMQQRYYDPEIGRFLSVDPVTFSQDKPQQFNRYWYANGNPYLYTDPDGREPGDFAAGFAMGLVFNEQEVATIAQAEAACAVCGSDMTDGMEAGQAAGALLENGVSVKGVVLAVGSLGGKKKGGRKQVDSSKSERHGDGGRAETKAEKQVADLESQLEGASRKDREKIKKKIQRITKAAAKKRRGEEHSRGQKR